MKKSTLKGFNYPLTPKGKSPVTRRSTRTNQTEQGDTLWLKTSHEPDLVMLSTTQTSPHGFRSKNEHIYAYARTD